MNAVQEAGAAVLAAPGTAVPPRVEVEVEIRTGAGVSAAEGRYARGKIQLALGKVRGRVTRARVRVARHAHEGPHEVVAQAHLVLDGRSVRAQARARTAQEAVDLLQRKLASSVERRAAGAAARPPVRQTRTSSSRVVRTKKIEAETMTREDAEAELEFLGYGFYLFTDAVTGRDVVLERDVAGHCRLHSLDPSGPAVAGLLAGGLSEAVARLDATNVAFVCFPASSGSTTSLLHRRRAGGYGLIEMTHPS